MGHGVWGQRVKVLRLQGCRGAEVRRCSGGAAVPGCNPEGPKVRTRGGGRALPHHAIMPSCHHEGEHCLIPGHHEGEHCLIPGQPAPHYALDSARRLLGDHEGAGSSEGSWAHEHGCMGHVAHGAWLHGCVA